MMAGACCTSRPQLPNILGIAQREADNERLLRELGYVVTLGLAAKPQVGDFIVTVSDTRIDLGPAVPGLEFGTIKFSRLDRYWGFLWAAKEIGYVGSIADLARTDLGKITGRRRTAEEVRDAVAKAYNDVRSGIIFRRFLQQFGYADILDFRKNVAKDFGAGKEDDLLHQVKSFDLGAELLIYGFDAANQPHIIEVRNPGDTTDRSRLPGWAIGSGRDMALGAFNSRIGFDRTPETLVYRCCEAKFISEFAGVGHFTTVLVWYADGTFAIFEVAAIDAIRKIYQDTRRDVPKQVPKIIGAVFERQKKRREDEVKSRVAAEGDPNGDAAMGA